MNKWLACALIAALSGCPDVKIDPDETNADPIVEFDPSRSIVPFPNNLLISQTTGKITLPAGCNESAATKATREGVLNVLDGFGTFETVMTVTLTKPLATDSQALADAAKNIALFKITADPSMSTQIPVVVQAASSIRYANQTKNADGSLTCDTPNPIDSIVIVPRVPLEQKSTYAVAITSGLQTADGTPYVPSFTWSLVRQVDNPVTLDDNGNVIADRTPLDPSTESGLASLLGIDLLWKAHAPVLQFLSAKGIDRDDTILAWSFKTQTTTDALDTAVAGGALSQLNDVGVTGPMDGVPVPVSASLVRGVTASRTNNVPPYDICDTGAGATAPAEPNDIQCFLKVSLGLAAARLPTCDATTCPTVFAAGTAACVGIYNCASISEVLIGRVKSPQFQSERPNPLASGPMVPGPWTDPVKPTKVKDEQLFAVITIPTGTPPAAGWPTALFQHGLGQSSSNIVAIGGALAKDPDGAGPGTGLAVIAIDAVAHGTRLVRISDQGACATAPLPTSCFAGFLSPDLGTTRDNIRQTVVDHQQVIASLKKCTAATCGLLTVDPAHLVYIGQSLGGIIGSTTNAINADLKAGVLNVPGVGWADIFENTDTLDIRCTLVDGLIGAGTLMGEPRDTKGTATETDDTGLCIGQEWKTQPGYRQFAAIGRWVLDPADPANFTTKLAPKKTLIQQVVGDKVVPNVATINEAALVGRASAMAAANTTTAGAPPPSPAICSGASCLMPTTSKYVLYADVAPNLAAGFPGNTFGHGSMLSPAGSVNGAGNCSPATPQFCDGVLGLAQMATDAVTFLQLNK